MLVNEVVAAVVGAVIVALLGLILRYVRMIAQLPERVRALDAENRRAHGDLWAELRRLAVLIERPQARR